MTAGNAAVFGYLALRPTAVEVDVRTTGAPPEPTPSSSRSSVPTPTATPTPTQPPTEPPVVVVFGDGYTAGSEAGGLRERNWTALVAAELDADVRPFAVSRSGYASVGLTGETFADLAADHGVADADVVVVFGSRNDLGHSADEVAQGAVTTFQTLVGTAPAADLVVVGPAWSNAAPPGELAGLSAAVRDAATDAGATFVDPLAQSWFFAPEGLIAADGVSPTDAGHAELAERLAPVIEQALAGSD